MKDYKIVAIMNTSPVKAVVVAFLLLLPIASYAQNENKEIDSLIADSIRNLGKGDSRKIFEIFSQHPVRATELLVNSLSPVKRGKYRHHPEVVWRIRALRFLTQLDFRARTKYQLTDDEKQFLETDAQGRIKFFGTWMSRDVAFVGPKDAQVEIIRQWRDWFNKNGKTHKYVNDTSLDDWYF